MPDVKQKIIEDLKKIVKDITDQDITPNLEHPKDEKHGDYSSNIAMAIFVNQESRIKNQEWKTPLSLAKKIADQFMIHNSKFMILSKIEAVPPGFINFWLSKEYLTTLMIRIISQAAPEKDEYGRSGLLENKKIMVEFTDPNPFKEFHIGHLRNITLGESYARLLESQGALVWRVNYQGDVGMHVAKAIFGVQSSEFRVRSKNKMTLAEKVKLLGEAYAFGSKAYEEDEQAKKEIQSINIKIYRKDPSIRELWENGRKWSLEYFERIYKRVGTSYKRYYFESEVADTGRDVVSDHIKDGIFEKSEGAVVFKGEKYGLHTRVFVTKEDYATYEAKDMALAGIKYKDFPYDKSIIITAHEQAPYFKVVLAAMKLVSPDLAEKTVHDSFGFVSLRDTKMSSRLGNIATGEWLLNEAKARIKKAFGEMDEETAEKVAVGAVKYSMLKLSKESDISFSFDESISLEGNSGPYLQYTFARTQSVLKKIKNQKSKIKNTNQNSKVTSQLQTEEISLLRALYQFPEVVGEAAESFAPNILCNYLFDLAQKFNLFYQKIPILHPVRYSSQAKPDQNDNVREFRLALTAAVGQVIKNGLYLLGIQAPEKM